MTMETFLIELLIASVFTGLATEAVKSIFMELKKTYHANILAGIVSIIISGGIGIAHILLGGLPFDGKTIIYLVALIFMSWICAMVGYDKVIQAISQVKTFKNSNDKTE